MDLDDPAVRDILKRARVARIATLSQNGHPSVNPLYFIFIDRKIWLGTADWTLAARNAGSDARVSLLFNDEQNPNDNRVLRIRGRASIRLDKWAVRRYGLRVARKDILTWGGIANWLSHPRLIWLRRYYTAQSHEKGRTCVIEVTPEKVELLGRL